MKKYFIIPLILIANHFAYSQSCKKLYKDKLEPNSKLISCTATSTTEELPDGSCVVKKYYTEDKTITKFSTLESKKSQLLHGLYREWWDDGTLVTSGTYSKGVKTGKWREEVYNVGHYVNGQKQGIWNIYNKDSVIVEVSNFLNGNLISVTDITRDSLGQVIEKLRQNTATIESPPRFPGCDSTLTPKELKKCSEMKMLSFLYSKVRYPPKSRDLDIQGDVLIQFAIDIDGSIIDIKVLNGVADDLKQEVMRVVQSMPKWVPGLRNGKPIKMFRTTFITFRIDK